MEVNFNGGRVLIRDSKYRRDPANDPVLEPTISTTDVEWMSFLDQVMDSSVACSALNVEQMIDGGYALRSVDGITLVYTKAEWEAFVAGVGAGEFVHPDLALTAS